MATVFEKLNLKDQREILVLNAPDSFVNELASLREVTIHSGLEAASEIDFALAFVMHKKQVDELAGKLAQRTKGDAILWFAYPKGTSKKYKCDFNRDNGWGALNSLGWETVRAVSVDEDWSALRLRRTEFIKAR
jgi:hypothetical protein